MQINFFCIYFAPTKFLIMENKIQTLPAEVEQIVNQSGVSHQKAQEHALSFMKFYSVMSEIEPKIQAINAENPSPMDMKIAREIRLSLAKNRVEAEKKKDELKRDLLNESNLIQACYNQVKAFSAIKEAFLADVEKFAERREAERKALLKAEREAELSKYTTDLAVYQLAEMSEESWLNLLQGQKLAYEARIEAEKKAEAERIAREKAEAEERERIRIENERLKAEAAAREKELAAERARVEAEQKKAEEAARKEREAAEKKLAEERAKAEAERKRIEAENQAKLDAEREKREQAERELKARRQAEERKAAEELAAKKEAEAAAKKAAKAPEKKKLQVWIDAAQMPEQPLLKEIDALAVQSEINAKFNAFKTWASAQINNL